MIAYKKEERGNRLFPKRFERNYCVLTFLRKTLEHIINNVDYDFDKILDYGCGNKPYKALFVKKCKRYIGADIEGNPEADIIIKNGLLDVESNSIDCVLSTQVLEHVENPIFYLKEANRVLKEKGILILSTHGFWKYHPDPTDYWRWTSDGLKKLIEENGFRVIRIYSVLSLPTVAIQLWQDATMYKVPKILRKLYVLICQSFMELIDKKKVGQFDNNASVFVLIAEKK